MENSRNLDLEKQILPEVIPALIQYIPSKEVDGFDGIQLNKILNNQLQPSYSQPFSSSAMVWYTYYDMLLNHFSLILQKFLGGFVLISFCRDLMVKA